MKTADELIDITNKQILLNPKLIAILGNNAPPNDAPNAMLPLFHKRYNPSNRDQVTVPLTKKNKCCIVM